MLGDPLLIEVPPLNELSVFHIATHPGHVHSSIAAVWPGNGSEAWFAGTYATSTGILRVDFGRRLSTWGHEFRAAWQQRLNGTVSPTSIHGITSAHLVSWDADVLVMQTHDVGIIIAVVGVGLPSARDEGQSSFIDSILGKAIWASVSRAVGPGMRKFWKKKVVLRRSQVVGSTHIK